MAGRKSRDKGRPQGAQSWRLCRQRDSLWYAEHIPVEKLRASISSGQMENNQLEIIDVRYLATE